MCMGPVDPRGSATYMWSGPARYTRADLPLTVACQLDDQFSWSSTPVARPPVSTSRRSALTKRADVGGAMVAAVEAAHSIMLARSADSCGLWNEAAWNGRLIPLQATRPLPNWPATTALSPPGSVSTGRAHVAN